jgi:hypothetical protein
MKPAYIPYSFLSYRYLNARIYFFLFWFTTSKYCSQNL